MRFGDLLRTTVLASAAGASALIVATIASAGSGDDPGVVWISLGWWVAATLIGMWLGRQSAASEPIRSLLASARTQPGLPELRVGVTFLNRLWPLMLCTIVAAALSPVAAQISAVVGGFLIIWSFAWRHQAGAVKAIEDRDGARFYVDHTRPWQPIRLLRTPGFRSSVVELEGITAASGQPPVTDGG